MSNERMIDQINEMSLATETYIGQHLDYLWDVAKDKKNPASVRRAAKTKYNEFARAENKRTGKDGTKYAWVIL
jgi:uncharacterized protein (UPF0147 family)